MNELVTPRPAATLIIVRDGEKGLEVLLAEKTNKVNFAAGAFVFPGGAVDVDDKAGDLFELSLDLNDQEASRRLGISRDGLSYWIAALRESFEEMGLLFARRADGNLFDPRALREPIETIRSRLERGEITFQNFLKKYQLSLATDELQYFSHWITQAGRPRRYDTRFFIARYPKEQNLSHDGNELVSHLWVEPKRAIEKGNRGEISLMFPTLKTLEQLCEFSNVSEALDFARSLRPVPPMNPRISIGVGGKKLLVPGDFAYAEVGKLDPDQKGTASRDIVPGVEVRLSNSLVRITAPNPSVMTGPGTNSYVIGDTEVGFTIIDPGPNIPEHIQKLKDYCGDKLRAIVCTHSHLDHSPAASRLRDEFDVPLVGMKAKFSDRQDDSFSPDLIAEDGVPLEVCGGGLVPIYTPGHASNQFCYLDTNDRILFTGDHVMQGSTVVINPPDGDMADYFDSLEKLRDLSFDWIAPGHGFLMENPNEVIDRLIAHRKKREGKVLKALAVSGGGTLSDLVSHAYDDVSTELHRLAERSLLAHLLKLAREGVVSEENSYWSVVKK